MDFVNLISPEPELLQGHIISIIGGGGKSTLLERLGTELTDRNLRVILTTTTKMQNPAGMELVLQEHSQNFISETRTKLEKQGIVTVAKDYHRSKEKLSGISLAYIPELKRFANAIIIEADGCRQRPLKTHKEYEPVVPVSTNHTIVICGADVVGARLSDKTVHRADLFAQKWNLKMDTVLTPELIAQELLSPDSYMRNIPIKSDITFYINKSDRNHIGAKLLAEHLMTKSSHPVFFGSLKKNLLTRISTVHAT